MDPQSFDLEHVKHIIEAALLTASEPLQVEDLQKLFDGELDKEALQSAIAEVAQGCEGRSIELVNVASGWRFRTRPEYQRFLDKMNPQKSPRYSRAVMETLAIVAYKQPVTRGDIEDIRGVAVSSNLIKALEARGWIDVVGNREVPGRPELFATTRQFLDDLNLTSLSELPALDELGQLVEAVAAEVGVSEEVAVEGNGSMVELLEGTMDSESESGTELELELDSGNGAELAPETVLDADAVSPGGVEVNPGPTLN